MSEHEGSGSRSFNDIARIALLIVVAGFAIGLAAAAWSRGVYNYNTETDFVGSFAEEAGRLLRGEPLKIEFHPPWYPVVLAGVYSVVREWFATGIAVSVLAGVVTILTSFALWRRALGTLAGLGAAVALMVSPTFAHFSAQTTSDVFSLAMYCSAMLATWVAARRRTVASGLLAGALIGLAVLTRTNNVVLFALLSFYLLPASAFAPADGAGEAVPPRERRPRALSGFTAALLGLAAPLLAWAAFATVTGAPITPTKTYENLALTYFPTGEDRISGDARVEAAARFSSSLDVLLEDPVHVLRTYLREIATAGYHLLLRDSLLPFPLFAVAAVAMVVIWIRSRERRLVIALLLGNLALMYLITTLKAYEDRYFLFLLPLVGASIGAALAPLLQRSGRPAARWLGWAAVIAMVGLAGAKTAVETPRLYLDDWATDALAAAEFLNTSDLPAPQRVYARKPHLAFYTGALGGRTMPPSEDLESLLVDIRAFELEEGPAVTYVFYGEPEKRTRPQFAALSNTSGPSPDGLTRVANGPQADGWVLYLVEEPLVDNAAVTP